MRKVIYSMMVSLDGFVAATDESLEWVTVDEEIHRFANEQVRDLGVEIYGRKVYQAMAAYWPTAGSNPSAPDFEIDFARIWNETPKIVFSKTLDRVEWNSTLVRGNVADEVARLKAQPGDDIGLAGANLAATFFDLGLIDECRPIVHPVILGAGTPFFPRVRNPINLELIETRKFASGAVYLRYAIK